MPDVAVIMGVSGAGKTTMGAALATSLGWSFQEGDDLHCAANVAKMRSGVPLTDGDRAVWLDRVKTWIDARLGTGAGGVITCSALKRRYRQFLAADREGVIFVYLDGGREEIRERLAARAGHFMPPLLLASQFADLEEPAPGEHVITVPVSLPLDEQVRLVAARLQAPARIG